MAEQSTTEDVKSLLGPKTSEFYLTILVRKVLPHGPRWISL